MSLRFRQETKLIDDVGGMGFATEESGRLTAGFPQRQHSSLMDEKSLGATPLGSQEETERKISHLLANKNQVISPDDL